MLFDIAGNAVMSEGVHREGDNDGLATFDVFSVNFGTEEITAINKEKKLF